MVTIYGLMCIANDFTYVGCTSGKLAKRMREHRCLLRAGTHKVSRMQADWKEHGEPAFQIRTLEQHAEMSLEAKRQRELHWMHHFSAKGRLYNEHMVSFRPTDEARQKGVAVSHDNPGNRWTPEANLKRRLAQLGKPKGHGAKISATKRANRDEIVCSATNK